MAGACLLSLPVAAQASDVALDFDFSASSVSILGGFVDVPPDGTLNTASGTIRFSGPGTGTIVAGAARLEELTLAGTFAKSDFGVNVNGQVGATLPTPTNGTLTAGLGSASFNPFLMNFTGFASCTGGTGCTVLGLPATFNSPKIFSIPSLAVANLNSVGNATVNGTFTFTLGGITAVLNLVGNEVGRTFIPEPNTATLLALGLAGFGIARRSLRRR